MTHILFLKDEKQDDPYAKASKERGYEPHFVNVLDHTFLNIERLKSALEKPESYAGLIVTSQRAVEAVALTKTIWKLPVYTVGPATWTSISKLGFENIGDRDSTPGTAESLADLIIQEFKGTKPLLYLVGDKSLYTLPAKLEGGNIPFERINVYETIVRSDVRTILDGIMQHISGTPWIVFFSPSGVKAAYEMINPPFKVASIGPTTREYLIMNGKECHATPSRPDPIELLDCINARDA